MGLEADIIGFGPINRKIAKHLDYSEMEHLEDGTEVISTFFKCNTTNQSYELADALGVDAWDFSTHKINKKNRPDLMEIPMVRLSNSMDILGILSEEMDTFFECYHRGWTFFYRPNG